nr:hypothetical protein [Tanacetum cinerariifolium]
VLVVLRNYEILHERDDGVTERPDKRQRSSDRHQPTSQQSSHRSHGQNNDRHGSDRRGGSDNHRSSNNNYSGSNNRNSGNGRDQRNRGHQSNRSANSGIPVMDVTRETGVSSPTDLLILVLSSPGVPLRATPTQFALRVDADTQESVVELLVLVSSVAKLAICRRIVRRTPLRVHLVRLIRSQWELSSSSGNFFWQWEHIPKSGKTTLEVGMDRTFNSQQSSPKLDVASAINGNFLLAVETSSGSGNTSLEVGKLY